MNGFVLAATAEIWSDLLEVVLWGLVAGIGLPIAFALAMRGLALGDHAKREGRRGPAAMQFAMGAVFSAICIAAIGFGLVSMFHR